jgi:site-specific DNA recombinase
MIAAIYARKSTEQNGVGEEEKSVTRQIEHATAYAIKKGWTVADEQIYCDDGISGAEFVKRPGFIRLMNALKPRPSFQVLVMSEESRLGREQIETAYRLKSIIDAGVRVFYYLEDRERTLGSALDKMMMNLTTFAAEDAREKAALRVYDAMTRKAKAGHVTGGKVYGYDNVEVLSPTLGPDGRACRLHVLRRINPAQAAVVRRVFELYASGKGLTRIAKLLNAEGIPPPRTVAHGWAPSCLRELLYRPLYHGEIVWNKKQKIVRGGTKARRPRPEAEWLSLAAPDLQIVPSDRWAEVQAKLLTVKTAYARTRTGTLLGRPGMRDFDSPYLLSGVARCGECGASIVALTRTIKGVRRRVYGCLYHHKRGASICQTSTVVAYEVLDRLVLDALAQALDDRVIEAALDRALQHFRGRQDTRLDRRTAIERELSLIDAHEQRLIDTLAHGGDTVAPLIARLKAEEARKKALIVELDTLAQGAPVVVLDEARIKKDLRARTADVRGLLGRHVTQARQILRKLLVGPLQCTAVEADGQRGFRISGEGTYARLMPPALCSTQVVSPTGFEPVLRP